MPLFKSRPENDTVADNEAQPARKGSIFSMNRSPSPPQVEAETPRRNGFFGGSGRASSDESSLGRGSSVRSGGTSFFSSHRDIDVHNDPSIRTAHQKVADAENAEREADRALLQARSMVKAAKEHVKILEKEAKEE